MSRTRRYWYMQVEQMAREVDSHPVQSVGAVGVVDATEDVDVHERFFGRAQRRRKHLHARRLPCTMCGRVKTRANAHRMSIRDELS